jgi:hypothetical protein
MQGWGWRSVHDPETLPRVMEVWTRSLKNGDSFEMVFPLRRHDGQFRSFLTRVEPIKDESGQVLRWFGTNTDITMQEESELREKKARQTAELLNRVGPLLAAELDPDRLTQKITDLATDAVGAEFGAFFHNVENEGGESYMLYTLAGVDREQFSRFPMPRNTAVFAPTFRGEGVVRSDDITADPRYGKSAPHHGLPEGHLAVRSYLAVPVKSRTGAILGGLFLGGRASPRRLHRFRVQLGLGAVVARPRVHLVAGCAAVGGCTAAVTNAREGRLQTVAEANRDGVGGDRADGNCPGFVPVAGLHNGERPVITSSNRIGANPACATG